MSISRHSRGIKKTCLSYVVLLSLLFIPLQLRAQVGPISDLTSVIAAGFDQEYVQFSKDITDAIGYNLSRSLPLHGTVGYSDSIISYFSIFGIKFGVSAGALASVAFSDPINTEKIFASENLYNQVSNFVNLPIPLISPYVVLRAKIDKKKEKKWYHPLIISIKYAGTTLLQDTINEQVQSIADGVNGLTAEYNIDSFGVRVGFPLWKFYHRNFQLNFLAGYNYTRGDISLGYAQTLDVDRMLDVTTNGDTRLLVVEDIEFDYSYDSFFESSSIDLNLNFDATMRFINITLGIGLIINSTTYFNRYDLLYQIVDFPGDGFDNVDYQQTRNDSQFVPTLGVIPKINLGIRMYVFDFVFNATTTSWSGKVALIF